jgi:hypothetical protein
MNSRIDLVADLNDEDDEGFGRSMQASWNKLRCPSCLTSEECAWTANLFPDASMLGEARDPACIRPGAMLVAGNRQAQAVVRVVAVDDDGQVHFTVLPGSAEKNRHLIGRALA